MAWIVKRDGVELFRSESESDYEAFAWLLRRVPYSIHHATTYEGYSIEQQ